MVSPCAPLSPLKGQDLLTSADLDGPQTLALLELARQLKSGERRIDLGGKVLGLIFTKASTRTRVSFTVAMARLGGQTVDLHPSVTQVGRGEPMADTARVLSRYVDALAIRTFAQQELAEYAHWASIPVINALTDLEHPCQALADLPHPAGTLREGRPGGLTLAYVGDGNNMAHSLLIAGALLGVNVRVGCPEGFLPDPAVVEQARSLAGDRCRWRCCTTRWPPCAAPRPSTPMCGPQWARSRSRRSASGPLRAGVWTRTCWPRPIRRAIVLHCLPAHRGEEISAGVIEGEASRVFDQAENRLHVQQALLAAVLGGVDG